MAKEWITGRNPVYESIIAHRRHFFELRIAQGVEIKGRLQDILEVTEHYGIPVKRYTRQQLDQLADNHQGLALQASSYPYEDLPAVLARAEKTDEPGFFLLLDTLQDPQNLGTLLRTAEAVGVHGVFIPGHRAAGVTPAVVHASSGASEHLRIAQGNLAQIIQTLKDMDVWVMGLEDSSDAQPIEKVNLKGALALVVGSEGSGLRELVRKSCDLLIQLPTRGRIESLNASVAGSIALYQAYLARRDSQNGK
jgi:23S rRNA (guanosine2251-2'-O)-methyltransferase